MVSLGISKRASSAKDGRSSSSGGSKRGAEAEGSSKRTLLSSSSSSEQELSKRKGGGGKGGGGGSKGGGSSGGRSSSKGYVSLGSSFSGRGASKGSAGGGSRVTIPGGTAFAGRDAGGGTRGQVYGGPRYNAGYPYGGGGSYVGNRGFPFGFWPIFIFPVPYYGNHAYGPIHNDSRPGGPMQESQVTLSSWATTNPDPNNSNATSPYYIIGDRDSLASITDALQTNCSATVSSAIAVDPNLVQPEQVVTYYRSGSFALALSSYNDPAQSINNQPVSNDTTTQSTIPDVPIPFGTNVTFLSCLNDTINAQIPILDESSAMRMIGSGVGLGQLALFWVILSAMGII